jgi:hypothetical protein
MPVLERPAVTPERARRVDRLARRAHAFHRFAHHPLCASYEGEVIRLGRRTRLCRGCTHAAGGAMLGASTGFALAPLAPSPVGTLLVAATLLAWVGSRRATDAVIRQDRPSKLLTRGAPSALLFAGIGAGARSGSVTGAALVALAAALLAAAVIAYRRRGPDRSACHACPERGIAGVCSGFEPIARREAAFARAAARILRSRARLPALVERAHPPDTNLG